MKKEKKEYPTFKESVGKVYHETAIKLHSWTDSISKKTRLLLGVLFCLVILSGIIIQIILMCS